MVDADAEHLTGDASVSRAEALLAGEKQLLEMVATGHPLALMLDRLCRLVDWTIEGCASSFLILDRSRTRVELAVGPGLPPVYIEPLKGRLFSRDAGACGLVASLKAQVIVEDVMTDPRWDPAGWPSFAVANGIRSCWSTPVLSGAGELIGTFAINQPAPARPTPHDLMLIEKFTHLAGIAIERTQILDDLKSSEARLRSTIDSIPGFVWSTTSEGEVDFLDQRWHDFTGASQEGSLGAQWQAAIHPSDADELLAYWSNLLKTGQPGEFEARLRRFDGTYRFFLIRVVPLRDDNGRIVKWYGLNTDIEDRKRAESLLAGEKLLLEMVASDAPLTTTLDALCTLVEQIADDCRCSILLIDPTGTHLQHGSAPSLPDSLNNALNGRPLNVDSGPCATAAYLNEQVISSDIESETRWSGYEWCPLALAHGLKACWSTPIASKSGIVRGIFAIYYTEPRAPTARDQELIDQITHIASIAIERTQKDTALKRSEAFLAKAQRLSLTGSFSWQVEQNEITWSEQAYRIFEFDQSFPVTLEMIADRVHPEDIPMFIDMLDRARGNGSDFEYLHRLLMPDGAIKYLHLVAHGTRDPDGNLEYIGAVQDVTEQKVSEEALEKLRSELAHVSRVTSLGAITASIAHEINQPLSGIITNASTCLRMLAADPPNVDGALETARRTIRDGNRTSEIITRLRALFSKKEAVSENVDLNEATREVVALAFSELQRARIVLRTEFENYLPLVTGDRVQLQQVILNLLLNAIDAMANVQDRSKQLTITTQRDDEFRVRLTVQDTGTGFDTESRDRLFEAFYTTKNDGMGIGLSISRSIIERHQGRLWATPNDGPGASFFFSIPQQREGSGDTGGQAGSPAQQVMRNL
jgi:PAS domain S-box-containing protein